jgi:hypothetical protein
MSAEQYQLTQMQFERLSLWRRRKGLGENSR